MRTKILFESKFLLLQLSAQYLKVVEGVATLSYVVTSVVSEELVLVAKEVVSYDEPAENDEETPYTEETVVDNGEGGNDTGLSNPSGESEPAPAPGPTGN